MKLIFRLRFHTRFGQTLFLSGNHAVLGNGEPEHALAMQYLSEGFWEVIRAFPDGDVPKADLTYHYVLREPDGSLIPDWGEGRTINPGAFKHGEVLVVDSWNNPGFYENAFFTKPFKEVLLKANHTEVQVPAPAKPTHTFKVKAPLLAKGQTLCLLGNGATLGNWSTTSPLLLNRSADEDFLSVQLDLSNESSPLAYKYGVFDIEQKAFVRYEDGANRTLLDAIGPNKHTLVNDGFAVLPSTTWKGAGVAIPVFSLRSERSFGVGEFADLKLLADWGQRVGLKLIQILPVNDTTATHTWTDSYPYAAISAFALHPLYLNLDPLVHGAPRHLRRKLENARKVLNALKAVDYEAVLKAKLECVREVIPAQSQQVFASSDFEHFFECNRDWLVPYAAFCHLREKFHTADFSQWQAHRRYQADPLELLAAEGSPARDDIERTYFIQYHLHQQLKEATDYARARGLVIKGDIPIGVSRHGADVWQQPELYHSELQAGAPPDAFAVKGQNWGFPTYNWPRMKEDGFAWWKRRFEQMADYFDAFRLDHILGFFRIWSIPVHAVEGILGYFDPAIPVHVGEFKDRGIAFDRERYVRPHITDAVLKETFGDDRAIVQRDFLVSTGHGTWSLKQEFTTQRQVERYFSNLEPTETNDRIKAGLYDLISNVILFEVEWSEGQLFHFRFAMETTSSFKNLDSQTQARLMDLATDYFFRRQDDFWMKEGMEKLPALKHVTNLLACGEDLGWVSACVPELMKRLGLLSLEVQRMPKDPALEFSRPQQAPYLSVVTPATHDMSTLRGWWEEDRICTQRFFNRELNQPGEAPRHCDPWVCQTIIRQHLDSPAMWSICQLQDLLGMDELLRRSDPHAERINVPANPRHYWQYRMHLPLETLLQAESFNNTLRSLIEQCGR